MNKQQIAEKLRENHQRFVEFAENLNDADFMFASENKWTAGQQLDHIVRSIAPLKNALILPNFIPKLLFGKANRDSMNYDELVKIYQTKLAEGGRASGRFVPTEISFNGRKALADKLLKLVEELCKNVESFDESQLDEFFLPHPLIGKLTLREMLYFTIYHVEHHHKNAIQNLGK